MDEHLTNEVPKHGRIAYEEGFPVEANPFDEHSQNDIERVHWKLWKWHWRNGLEYDRDLAAEYANDRHV